MRTESDRELSTATVELAERSAVGETPIGEPRPLRRVDCSAMKQMALPDLLYYVLAGDGHRVAASS